MKALQTKPKLIPHMDIDVWNRFAAYCKYRGKSISDGIKEVLEKVLKEEDKK